MKISMNEKVENIVMEKKREKGVEMMRGEVLRERSEVIV